MSPFFRCYNNELDSTNKSKNVHYILVPKMQNKGTVPKNIIYRKTSAEIIKEAQNSLSSIPVASSGAKLVSTRRPITPNVNNRQLYGSAYTGSGNRPPSAFNLKYLQYDMRALSCCLEPIDQSVTNNNHVGENQINRKIQRSNSSSIIHENGAKARLPALKIPATQNSGSLENCENN